MRPKSPVVEIKVGDRVEFFRDGQQGTVLQFVGKGWIRVKWDKSSAGVTMIKNVEKVKARAGGG